MTRFHHLASALLISALAVACDKAADEDHKASSAQAEANDKIAAASKEASDKSKTAQAEADKKIAEAQGEFEKTREAYRHKSATDLADLDQKIAKLEAKAKTATGTAQADQQAALKKIRDSRETFVTHSKVLERETAKTWDETKATIEKEWKDLTTLVDKAG